MSRRGQDIAEVITATIMGKGMKNMLLTLDELRDWEQCKKSSQDLRKKGFKDIRVEIRLQLHAFDKPDQRKESLC